MKGGSGKSPRPELRAASAERCLRRPQCARVGRSVRWCGFFLPEERAC
jgi:hypothetical protein